MRPKEEFPDGTTERMEYLLNKVDNADELKRIQGIYFRAKYNLSAPQIAQMIGWKASTVRNLHYHFMRAGEAALNVRGRGGRRHAHLSQAEETAFIAEFVKAGEAGEMVEISAIHHAYEHRVNQRVARSTVYRLLHRHGWRKLTPRPIHPKANPEVMEAFKKNGHS